MLPKLPDQIQILNVPVGSQANSSGGFYVGADAEVTARIDGDTFGVFSVVEVRTFDVESEPDIHPPRLILVPAVTVNGAGPIQVFAGEALLAYVEFSCPPNPGQSIFKATVLFNGTSLPGPLKVPIVGTANLGRLDVLPGPIPSFVAGEKHDLSFQILSSLGSDALVQWQSNAGGNPHFFAPNQFPPPIPPGGTISVSVSLTCFPDTPEGNYGIAFDVAALNGSVVLASAEVSIPVIAPVLQTSISADSLGFTMTRRGIAPINVTIQSVRSSDTQVSFALQNPAPGLSLSGPPIPVASGSSVFGTVWLNAEMGAPDFAIVTLVQTASNSDQAIVVSPSVQVAIVSPVQYEDYFIVRVYWGQRWIDGDPFSWTAMEEAVIQLAGGAFVRGLREYGVGNVLTSGHPLAVAVEPAFIPSGNFNDSDLTNLISGLIDGGRLPTPDSLSARPLYFVFPPEFSHYSPNPSKILGAHGAFDYRGSGVLYAWAYQGSSVSGTTPTLGHEIAEALCAERAEIEVGDPCEKLVGNCDGLTVQPYLSKQRNMCVLPDLTSNSAVAAVTPSAATGP